MNIIEIELELIPGHAVSVFLYEEDAGWFAVVGEAPDDEGIQTVRTNLAALEHHYGGDDK